MECSNPTSAEYIDSGYYRRFSSTNKGFGNIGLILT